ncbi:MAG TPA: hypothetical protein VKG80_21460, partial [Trebonia sp.]|nr:hypothetical protein [Trebonia sp.]
EELAKDSGRADTGGSGDTIVARLDAATRVREGAEAELWVDARAIHVFDPASGRNLSLGDGDGDGDGRGATPAAPPASGTTTGTTTGTTGTETGTTPGTATGTTPGTATGTTPVT